MNKKLIVFCSILAILLLAAIGFGFYKLFDVDNEPTVQIKDSRMDAFNAVPADAILILDINELSQVEQFLVATENPISSFISTLPEGSDECSALFSLHYSSKNEISPLFVLSIPQEWSRKDFLDQIARKCLGISSKQYDGNTIFCSEKPAIYYAVCENHLVASPSIVVLESSLRHLENNASILDNDLFRKMSKISSSDMSLHFNHINLDKIFYAAVKGKFQRYADFPVHFSNWSTIDLYKEDTHLFGRGSLLNTKDELNYSNIFLQQKSKVPGIFNVLPHNTNYVVSFPLSSVGDYLLDYRDYLEARKRLKTSSFEAASEWFSAFGVAEVAFASFPLNEKNEKVTFIKINEPNKLNIAVGEVFSFENKGYISTILGGMFTPTAEEAYSLIDGWMVVGSKDAVEELTTNIPKVTFFPLSDYIVQTPAAEVLKEHSSFCLVMNLSRCKDSLSVILKEQYATKTLTTFEDKNFEFLTYSLSSNGKELNCAFDLYLDNLSQLPRPLNLPDSLQYPIVDDTPLIVPSGPFEIKNFITGKTNYIIQEENNMIRLADENKRGIWTIPFSSPICGSVSQIDYFKNGKLQILFASGTKIYLLDRLGRWVHPFPKDLKKEILMGPKVFDFSDNRVYTIMVLHTDNTLGMYDIMGKPINSWTPITSNERIREFPELLQVGGARYWVVRTLYQTLIFNKSGVIIADFSKKNKLKMDTEIVPLSSNEVIVTTVEDKEVVLDLVSGNFRKR